MFRFCAIAVVLSGLTSPAYSQNNLRAAPSTHAIAEVQLLPSDQGLQPATPKVIRIDYGVPHLRGRMLHTDSLVPYDKPWRLGANAATRLTTDVDIVLGGKTITKGTYVLFAVPSRASWQLIVQKNQDSPEVTYEASNDLMKIELKRTTLAAPTESLSIAFLPVPNAVPARGELRVSWGTSLVTTDWSVK
ncbi:MAG TPA: DUF2911 domain-containing protein [Gemmatimonadaceae bacterium]|nr:DUF2911 domain-containing protein [Gemmatimonadaceae bacterium]